MKEAKREAEAVIGNVRAEKEAAFQSSSNEVRVGPGRARAAAPEPVRASQTQNQDEFLDMKKVTDAEIAAMTSAAPASFFLARVAPRTPVPATGNFSRRTRPPSRT